MGIGKGSERATILAPQVYSSFHPTFGIRPGQSSARRCGMRHDVPFKENGGIGRQKKTHILALFGGR